MAWWAWVCLGLALLGLELGLVDAAFYLVFLGASALIVGLMIGFGVDMPVWGQLVTFAVLAIISMVFFRERFHSLVRGRGNHELGFYIEAHKHSLPLNAIEHAVGAATQRLPFKF